MTALRPRAVDWHRIGRRSAPPLQRWMLETIAGEGNEPRSPTGLLRELELLGTACPVWPIPPLQRVSYHVKALVDTGALELRRRDMNRGAVEHFYAVSEDYLLAGQAEAAQRMRAAVSRLAAAGPDHAAQLAQLFHETYERLAPAFGYETREASAKPWAEVPDTNKRLMIAVCGEVLETFALQADIERVSGVGHDE